MINSRVLLPNGTKVWSLFIFPDQIEALGCARQHQLQAADEVKRRRLWARPIAACHNGTLSAVSDIFNNPVKIVFSMIIMVFMVTADVNGHRIWILHRKNMLTWNLLTCAGQNSLT